MWVKCVDSLVKAVLQHACVVLGRKIIDVDERSPAGRMCEIRLTSGKIKSSPGRAAVAVL